jgi:hypothetical protein
MARHITRFLLVIWLALAVKAADWQIEVVDASGVGMSSSLKIDKEGNAHLCYVIAHGGALKYSFWQRNLNRWFTMVVDASAGGCDLALDSKQHPHIAYEDFGTASGSRLRYAYWDGSSWNKQPIPLNSDVIAGYMSIAMDPKDQPSIAFYEYRGPKGSDIKIRLRNVMWNGKNWEVRTVDSEEGSGKVNSMVSDSQGHFYLVYGQVSIGESRYAFWNGKSWELEKVESHEQAELQYVGLSCAIALDKQGTPQITYMNGSSSLVKYAIRRNGHWDLQVVDRIKALPMEVDRSSIAIDDQGTPYIAYHDAGMGTLKLARKEGSKWQVETVDGNGVGFTSSMAIDRGVLWISYADEYTGTLKVARQTLTQPDAAGAKSAGAREPSQQVVK